MRKKKDIIEEKQTEEAAEVILTNEQIRAKWLECDINEYLTSKDFMQYLFTDENFDSNIDRADFLTVVKAKLKKTGMLRIFNERYAQYDNFVRRQREEFEKQQNVVKYEERPPYIYTNCSGMVKLLPNTYADYFKKAYKHYIFKSGRNTELYVYVDGVYRLIDESGLTCFIRRDVLKHVSEEFDCYNTHDVSEAYANITAVIDAPGIERKADYIAENVINFVNGLLLLPECRLIEHSPDYFTINQIPCEWDEFADEPTRFNTFLDDLFGERDDTKLFIREWLGLIMSNISFNRHNFKKALLLQGPGNSGKSKLKELAEKIVGDRNCLSISLQQLTESHVSSSIIGKRLIGSNDMKADTLDSIEMFMSLTGSDSININPKFKDAYSGYYSGFIWNCCNILPIITGTKVKEFYDRLILIKTEPPISEERRDAHLVDHLLEESAGIIKICVDALVNLINRNYKLTIPQENEINVPNYQRSTNYAAMFYDECCTEYDYTKANGSPKQIRDAFVQWCSVNVGNRIISVEKFNSDLAEYLKIDKSLLKKAVGTKRERLYCFEIREDSCYLPEITLNSMRMTAPLKIVN